MPSPRFLLNLLNESVKIYDKAPSILADALKKSYVAKGGVAAKNLVTKTAPKAARATGRVVKNHAVDLAVGGGVVAGATALSDPPTKTPEAPTKSSTATVKAPVEQLTIKAGLANDAMGDAFKSPTLDPYNKKDAVFSAYMQAIQAKADFAKQSTDALGNAYRQTLANNPLYAKTMKALQNEMTLLGQDAAASANVMQLNSLKSQLEGQAYTDVNRKVKMDGRIPKQEMTLNADLQIKGLELSRHIQDLEAQARKDNNFELLANDQLNTLARDMTGLDVRGAQETFKLSKDLQTTITRTLENGGKALPLTTSFDNPTQALMNARNYFRQDYQGIESAGITQSMYTNTVSNIKSSDEHAKNVATNAVNAAIAAQQQAKGKAQSLFGQPKLSQTEQKKLYSDQYKDSYQSAMQKLSNNLGYSALAAAVDKKSPIAPMVQQAFVDSSRAIQDNLQTLISSLANSTLKDKELKTSLKRLEETIGANPAIARLLGSKVKDSFSGMYQLVQVQRKAKTVFNISSEGN